MTVQPGGQQAATAAGKLSGGAIASLTGVGVLLIFIIQNTDRVRFQFLFWTFTWPLVVHDHDGAVWGAGVVRVGCDASSPAPGGTPRSPVVIVGLLVRCIGGGWPASAPCHRGSRRRWRRRGGQPRPAHGGQGLCHDRCMSRFRSGAAPAGGRRSPTQAHGACRHASNLLLGVAAGPGPQARALAFSRSNSDWSIAPASSSSWPGHLVRLPGRWRDVAHASLQTAAGPLLLGRGPLAHPLARTIR